MKVTEKLLRNRKEHHDYVSCSFEYFPPKTHQGMENLYNRMERMAAWGQPDFIDITWGAGGYSAQSTSQVTEHAQKFLGLNVCMHLTCTDMTASQVVSVLDKALEAGCNNILALRGDKPIDPINVGEENIEFHYAIDLVRFIREKYGNRFCIGVAGYSEAIGSESIEDNVRYLKNKCDAGADFIITQMFYDVDKFLAWYKLVRESGIEIPVFPGIMPIYNYDAFLRRAKWSECHIPEPFLAKLEPIKNNDEEVREVGSELVKEMCITLIRNGIRQLHFYTMNLETPVRIIIKKLQEEQYIQRQAELPWRKSSMQGRALENVRPIFWKYKCSSYIHRTYNWDEFPNGRWGNAASPAFEDIARYGVHLKISKEKALKLWGEPHELTDILSIFIRFIEGKLEALPWSDTPIAPEARYIQDELIGISQLRILVVNSQPAIDSIPSDHPDFGWGPKGGFLYQKAYLEMFVHPIMVPRLIENSRRDPNISYYIVNCQGDVKSNAGTKGPNALTWGVFPGKEILQPTIVDLISFLAWKDEAYKLGKDWAAIYAPGSLANNLINSIMNDWLLCVIVHNDYHKRNAIFKVLQGIEPLKCMIK